MTQPPPDPTAEYDAPPGVDTSPDPGIADPVPAEPRSKGSLIMRGALWQAVSQVAPLVINLVLTPYIVAGLGAEIYAIFLLVSGLQVFMAAVDGGIGPSANRYFTVYAGRDDREATTRLLTTLAVVIAALTVVVFGIFYTIAPALLAFFPTTKADPAGSVFFLRTMVVLVAVNQVRSLFAYVLYANHKFAVTTLTMLLGYVVYVIGLLWTIHTGRGLVGIAWMFVVQQCLATLLIIPSACRYLTRRGIGFVERPVLADFFGYSWKAQLSSLLDVVGLQGDTMIVQRVRPREATPFGLGGSFAQQLRMVPLNAYAPIQSTVGRAVGELGPKGALATFEKIHKPWVIGVTGWVAVGAPAAYFGLNAWLHEALKGSALGGMVAATLLVGNLFWLLSTIQIIWCLSVGRSDIELRYGIVAVVLNLVGTFALIIPFGVEGSVIATAVSQLVSAVYLVTIMRQRLDVAPRSPFTLVPVVPAICCAALSFVGAWAASHLTGSVVPYGALSLFVCGLGSLPAFVLYILWTLGLHQVRTILGSRIPALAPRGDAPRHRAA